MCERVLDDADWLVCLVFLGQCAQRVCCPADDYASACSTLKVAQAVQVCYALHCISFYLIHV